MGGACTEIMIVVIGGERSMHGDSDSGDHGVRGACTEIMIVVITR